MSHVPTPGVAACGHPNDDVRNREYRGYVGPLEEQITRVLGSHDPPSMITRDLSLTVMLQRMHRAIVLLAAAIDGTDAGAKLPPAPPEP